jgi:hypothetical protein
LIARALLADQAQIDVYLARRAHAVCADRPGSLPTTARTDHPLLFARR